MRGGDLDQRVTLLARRTLTDAAGGIRDGYVARATVWAKVAAQRGDESFKAAQERADRFIKIKLRWRADVTVQWCVQWNGESYDITDVDRSLRRAGELWLMATLRGADLGVVGPEQRVLAAGPGAFAVTGQAARLTRQRHLQAGAGDFVVSGMPALLTYHPAGDADALAYFAAAPITDDFAKTGINKFITEFKSAVGAAALTEVFDELVLCGVESSGAGLTDVVARCTPLLVSSPTFTAYKGFENTSIGQYIRPGFNPTAQGSQFAQSSHCWWFWVDKMTHAGSNPQNFAGQSDDVTTRLMMWPEVGGGSYGAYDTGYASVSASNSGDAMTGLWAMNRTVSGVKFMRDNTAIASGASAATALLNLEFGILAENHTGSGFQVATNTGHRISAFGFGRGLAGAEFTALYNGLATLAADLGW